MIKLLLMLIIAASLMLSACGDDSSKTSAKKPTPRPAKTQKAATKPAADGKDEKKTEYVYYPEGKRDPFESPLLKEEDEDTPLTPLQHFDTTQLLLTGVIMGFDVPKAMVKAPDGKSYILSIGTLVGKNGGKVSRIDNEGVSVEEILKDFSGETRVNTVLIALPKRKGVK